MTIMMRRETWTLLTMEAVVERHMLVRMGLVEMMQGIDLKKKDITKHREVIGNAMNDKYVIKRKSGYIS